MKNKYIVYLHSCGFSHKELTHIFSVESSTEDFFITLNNQALLRYIKNVERRKKILEKYEKINTDQIDKILLKLNINLIILSDSDYPECLKHIPNTPYILYVRGELPVGDMFGVVGSRKISSYGERVISQIVPDISRIFSIVSGGASGCDTMAHKMALGENQKTIVVVGTGIDQTYPVTNTRLFEDIVLSGSAILSIFPLGEPGLSHNFPVRNEIVVGLSEGILVVEAQKKSGSLITAQLCLDLGKDLFAIPGDITHANSQGTNKLIQKGEAKGVMESYDILEEYDVFLKQNVHKKQLPLLDEMESSIYQNISNQDLDIDTLSMKIGKPVSETTMKLSMLELKKLIKKNIAGKYTLL